MTQIREQIEYDFQAFSSRGRVSAAASLTSLGTISIVTSQGAFWPMVETDQHGARYIYWHKLDSWLAYQKEGWSAAKWAQCVHDETEIPVEPLLALLARYSQFDTAILPGHLLQAIVERMPK